jgi:hypothetical protein
MREKEIDRYIELLKRVEAAKAKLPTLKIDWETDIKRMDFHKLFSFKNMKDIKLNPSRVEIRSVEKIDEDLFRGEDAERMLDLIELAVSGEKIIPPMYSINYMIRDGKKMAETNSYYDGLHRRILASFIGLSEIPTVIFEIERKYQFSVSKWEFEFDGDMLIVKSLINDDVYTFDLKEWFVGPSEKYEFLELTRRY